MYEFIIFFLYQFIPVLTSSQLHMSISKKKHTQKKTNNILIIMIILKIMWHHVYAYENCENVSAICHND